MASTFWKITISPVSSVEESDDPRKRNAGVKDDIDWLQFDE
jgi:hypothetical protein